MRAFLDAFRHFSFKGRVSRRDYWIFCAFFILSDLVFMFALGFALYSIFPEISEFAVEITINILSVAYSFLWISMTVKRLHDIGKTGYWVYLYLIPLIGSLTLLAFSLFEGEPVANAYGPPPTSHTKQKNAKQEQSVTESVQLELPQSTDPEFADDSRSVQMQMDLSEITSDDVISTQELEIARRKSKRNKTLALVVSVFLAISIIGNIALGIELNKAETNARQQRANVESLREVIADLRTYKDAYRFYARYAKIVPVGSNTYHKYGCDAIDGKSFYIYNIDAAKARGYSMCQDCHSSFEINLDKLPD